MELDERNEEDGRRMYGPIWSYVRDDSITDIDYDGKNLWLISEDNRRWKEDASGITDSFLKGLSDQVSMQVQRPFNTENPVLEAEAGYLRITMVHETAAVTGRSFCIRKSLPKLRFTAEQAIGNNMYCSKEVLALLINLILAKSNIVFCGEPRSGKTECAKFLSQYIPADQKVVTIEDTLEWYYKEINPESNAIELKVSKFFDYTRAIKTCMRLNPDWVMLSEARSTEVSSLLEAYSTGVKGLTTIHTDDVRNIPDRMLNMMQEAEEGRRLHDIYEFIDAGVRLKEVPFADGSLRKIIAQVCYFEHTESGNRIHMILEDGMLSEALPAQLVRHLLNAGIKKPFQCACIKNEK